MCLSFGDGQLQPMNFMIGDLTFERPPAWKWIETASENEKARLFIYDKVLNDKSIVSFEVLNSHLPDSFIQKWKEPYLSNDPEPTVQLTTNQVNHRQVVTVDISGTKRMKEGPVKNQATHGVVIDLKDEQIGARILASKPLVDQLKPVFKRMIDDALKTDE